MARTATKQLSKLNNYKFYQIVFVVVFVTLFSATASHYRQIYCTVQSYRDHWLPGSRLMSCSAIRQNIRVSELDNVVREQTDVPGWDVFTTKDKNKPGSLVLHFTKDRDYTFFYPRVYGVDSTIQIYEKVRDFWQILASISGKPDVWSAIGKQYLIPVHCLQEFNNAHEFEATLHFVLTGPWCQIWVKDSSIIF